MLELELKAILRRNHVDDEIPTSLRSQFITDCELTVALDVPESGGRDACNQGFGIDPAKHFSHTRAKSQNSSKHGTTRNSR